MQHSPGTSTVTITILAVGAIASVAALLMFGPAGLPVPLLAAGVLLSQRSSLARAVGPHGERHRAGLAAVGLTVSTIVFLATLAAWFTGIRRGYGFGDTVLVVFNVLGFGSLMGIVVFGVTVLARRRKRRPRAVA